MNKKTVVSSNFWRQVNYFVNDEFSVAFDRQRYLELYAVMYDNGWLTDDDLEWLDYEGLPEA